MNTDILKSDIAKIKEARELAFVIHANDKRKGNGLPYFEEHIEPVAHLTSMLAGRNHMGDGFFADLVVSAYLHDTFEDHPDMISLAEIEKKFGATVSNIVDAVTRRKDETYYQFIMRIAIAGRCAALVKVADITHNLSDGLSEGSLKDKYRFARDFLVREYSFEGIDLDG